jgi:transposase-like protein
MESSSSKYSRRYDSEFKENAVELVQSGKSITQVARDLGVSHWSLSRWVKLAQAGLAQVQVGTLETETPQQREMRRLRHEIDYLRRQRDILKKALGIVSAEMPTGDLR